MPQTLDNLLTLPAEHGVYYAAEDAPCLIVRFLVDLIDVCVIVAMVLISSSLMSSWFPDPLIPINIAIWCYIFLCWCYLVLLKVSGVGTLGYALFRLRVVTLRNERPSLIRMTFRLGLSLIFNPLVDLAAVTVDNTHQAVRDRLAGTYVIRRRATPAGHGPIVRSRLFFMNLTLLYEEVQRQSTHSCL